MAACYGRAMREMPSGHLPVTFGRFANPHGSAHPFGDGSGVHHQTNETTAMTNTNLIPSASSIEIQFINNQSVVSSKALAEHFGKQHKDVLRKIELLKEDLEPAEWYERNFTPIQIDVDLGQGRTRQDTAYAITRDGFTLLAMGFTGKRALRWKIAYIEAFNRMEEEMMLQLMAMEDKPEQCDSRLTRYDCSMDQWVEVNPWFSAHQDGPFGQRPDSLTVRANMLLCQDYRSPLEMLLHSMRGQGCNVTAYENELNFMRDTISEFYNALTVVQQAANSASRFSVQYRMRR
jgi:Rha family phage regulatory protein